MVAASYNLERNKMSEKEDEEEKARTQAEARRQRIIDGAANRMDKVSGLGENENKGSSKLAAMRRRRFKKKQEEADETTPKEDEEEKTPEPPKEEEEKTKPNTNVATEEEPVVEEVFTPGAQQEEKKKYMGVAKMRRLKLQEKKQQEAVQQSSTDKTHIKRSATTLADRIPIYMHVVVVLMLFGAGLDVGLQMNLSYSKGDLPGIIQRGPLGPLEMKFVNIVPSAFNPWSAATTDKAKIITEDIATSQEAYQVVDNADEFDDDTPKRGVDNHDANVDPLFGVDLDKYTAGSGMVMFLGRQAVKVHRLNLAIFLYGPHNLVKKIAGLFRSFLMVPPVLGIIAFFIRQVVASALGAQLPAVVEDEALHKDLVSTGVNFVKNFLAGSFPKLVSFYKAWTHLRSDMYVVTCGCLVGLAISHSILMQGISTEPATMEQPITTGDEL